jgi:hypothetical protein
VSDRGETVSGSQAVPTRALRAFWLAFVGYFLLAAAWALALPVNGTYDEKQHIVRAYAVVTGQWVPSERAVDAAGWPVDGFRGPRSLLPENPDCAHNPRPPRPASCQIPRASSDHALRPEGVGREGTEVLPSGAGRYSPVYYLPVGLPLLVSPDASGVVWARLVSALLSALLLAAAAWAAVRIGSKLLLVGLVLVGTPLAMNLAGSVNPNGLEISAGVLLFVALVGGLRGNTTGRGDRRLLGLAGFAGVLLITVRHLGPVLFVIAVIACLVVAGVPRDRRTWTVFGAWTAAGVVAAIAWLFVSSAADIAPLESRRQDLSPGQILGEIAGGRAEFYVRQVVAQFGYGETTVSLAAIGLWYLLVAALVAPALWYGSWRLRIAIAGLFAACAVLLVGLELYFVPKVGWFSHARYVMPIGVGIVLFAAYARQAARWHVLLVALTFPVHLYALARVMTRYQRGIDAGLNPFGGVWQPIAGSLLPLFVLVVGASSLVVLVWLHIARTVDRAAEHSTAALQTN